jgi:GNAT superfamily N-acetyltransferase
MTHTLPPGCSIDTDPARLDVDLIHRFLATSYWAQGIPRAVVERAIAGSLCFGLYEGAAQVGFARVITDRATFAYLADVFVVESRRGRGLSKTLIAAIRAHPALQDLRRWLLVTRDAHALYAQFGFTPLTHVDRYMQCHDPDVYVRASPP